MFRAAMGHFLVHFLGYSLFAVWVTVWVRQIRYLKIRTNKRENRRKSLDFHRFLELVAGLEPATC